MAEPTDPQSQITALDQLDDTTLRITFADGLAKTFPVRFLRLKCPCAHCIDEMTGKLLLNSTQVPTYVHPKNIETVGRYALRIHWSDNHNTGIYTFKMLRNLQPPDPQT